MGEIISPTNQRTPSSVGKLEDSDLLASSSALPTLPDRSPSSDESTPDHDHDGDHDLDQDLDLIQEDVKQQPAPPTKRKGGRKPIYATSEERKQRNRQAQAAFRERRTEYIKQLETTIKRHEDTLSGLQQSQRQALDECLMLRYKNSLLERILIEKGIDVQAELRAQSSPPFGATRTPNGPNAATGPQGIRRIPGGRYARRPLSISAKPDHISADPSVIHNRSPLAQATTASHISSPIALTRSPNFVPQGGTISPSFGPTAQPGQQLRQQQPLRPQPQYTQAARPAFAQATMGSGQSSASGSSLSSTRDPNYFVSPFQNHYDQLDQEYDAQANMLDDSQEVDSQAFPTSSFSAPVLPPQVQQAGVPPMSPSNPNHNPASMPPPDATTGAGSQVHGLPAQFDPYDPMLDADPFGLTASMHFPTQFQFDSQR